jgi:hypothetical protein
MTIRRILGYTMVAAAILVSATLCLVLFGPERLSNGSFLWFGIAGTLVLIVAAILLLAEGAALIEDASDKDRRTPASKS